MNKREASNIILTGFMASGKTTLSKKLEKSFGYTRISTDEMIVEKLEMSINEIFDTFGEEYFRKLENEILLEVIEVLKDSSKNFVVDCGGGICYAENLVELKNFGEVYFLNVPFERLLNRLEKDTTRPLARDKNSLRRLYQVRLKAYKKLAVKEIFGVSTDDFVKELGL